MNQTPLGPTAVSDSFQTLFATREQQQSSPVPDPVPEPERTVTSAAELLTASFIVTSLTSASEEQTAEAAFADLNSPSAFNIGSKTLHDDYGYAPNAKNDTVGEGLDPPEWITERREFIHHATESLNSHLSEKIPLFKDKLASHTDDTTAEDDMLRTLSKHWSRTVLEDLLAQPRSQCALLQWGSMHHHISVLG